MSSVNQSVPRRLGVAPVTPALDGMHAPEVLAQVRESSSGVATAQAAAVVEQAPHWDHDPEEWMPAVQPTTAAGGGTSGLVRRCQQGRFDSWHDGRVEQCRYPAARGSEKCSDHGGVAVAKKLLQENAVLMMTELVRIALDPDEKTADKLAALNSGLDRTGGLGRTVTQPETEVRSALMARLEAAYDQVVQQSKGEPVAAGVVAAQEPASLARSAIAREAATAPVAGDVLDGTRLAEDFVDDPTGEPVQQPDTRQ